MSLARTLSRRTASILPLVPHYIRLSHQQSGNISREPTEADDDAPSTSTVGWLRGPSANKPNKSMEEEWEELRDAQTGAISWRSKMTGETTVPGAPKPDTWFEVVDKQSGLIYYWCKRTGDTTMLGEPKPGPYGRKVQLDAEDLQLEEGRGRGKEAEGPSLMRLVVNPLVIGVSLLAIAGIAYETLVK